MRSSVITLDHAQGISLDRANPPFNNSQAFGANYTGLNLLARTVREHERQYVANDPHAKDVAVHLTSAVPAIVPCAFNWFAVTVVNYLRLVGLVQLMNTKGWKSDAIADAANREAIQKHCREYVKLAIPEICLWRNKVAAHFAATDPFRDDNLGTLEQSIMNPVSYRYPHYHVGLLLWNTKGETSQLQSWSLTEQYESLAVRYWPELKLPPVESTAG